VQNAGYELTFDYDRNNQWWAELFKNVSIKASEKNQKERYRQKKNRTYEAIQLQIG
jgi:hypothetical protein